jgi:ABC-type branched-subunit amino acid transport system ATPase component
MQRKHIHALIAPDGASRTTWFSPLKKFLVPTVE